MTKQPYKTAFQEKSIRQNPYPFFRELLSEPAIPKVSNIWLLSRYEDCLKLLKYPSIGRELDGINFPEPCFETHPLNFVMRHIFALKDAPDHTRIRNAFNPYFSRNDILQMRDLIQQEVDELINQIEQEDTVELMHSYAVQLPFKIISTLLGIPAEYHLRLISWVHDLRQGLEDILPPMRKETLLKANAAAKAIYELFSKLVTEKQQAPNNDLLSKFVLQAKGNLINFEELVSGSILMLPAGTQTTLQTIGNSIYTLLRNEEQKHQFLELTDTQLDNAVEELIRYESPVKCLMRTVKRDLVYRSHTMRRGEQVCFFYAAANRDARVFPKPDTLDLMRPNTNHIAFSAGLHHCLGLHLGRLEVNIALKTLFQRLPGIKLIHSEGQWEDSFFSRQLLTLPVTTR